RRTVDQQLQLAALGRHSREAPLVGSTRGPRAGGAGAAKTLVVPCFGERHRSTAKSTFGAHPADIPVRAAAAGAVIRFVRAIDDVVPALRQTRREIRRGPLINENVRHSCRSTFPEAQTALPRIYAVLLAK